MLLPVVVILAVGAWSGGRALGAGPYGLGVRNGVLVKSGEPYRGIGVNCFDLFSRKLKDPADKSSEAALRQLADADIPFVRFMCCGFWPVDWDLYLQDKQEYFRRLDEVVHCAENCNVGLIPSLFWYVPAVPDIVGEPMDQFADPNSRTCRFIRRYTEEVVNRYKDSPAIWGWEFGNEFNLGVDLPNAAEHRPAVVPKLKTATKRTARDEFSTADMLGAYEVFARAVRKHDSYRILITGNSIPRPSAFHNTHDKNWTADTPEQFGRILMRDNPDPFDVISVHIYPRKDGIYAAKAGSVEELVAITERFSSKAGKPLFVGEFGVAASSHVEADKATFKRLLASLVDEDVPLSAMWVYDFSHMEGQWNATFGNDRAYMLEMISQADRRISRGR